MHWHFIASEFKESTFKLVPNSNAGPALNIKCSNRMLGPETAHGRWHETGLSIVRLEPA